MPVNGANQEIQSRVLSWEGVEVHPHRFGGSEFRLGKREIGHIHGNWLVDIPFPKKIRDEVVANRIGRAASYLARQRLGQFLPARRG